MRDIRVVLRIIRIKANFDLSIHSDEAGPTCNPWCVRGASNPRNHVFLGEIMIISW